MFMCYCIDRDAGQVHQESVFNIVREVYPPSISQAHIFANLV
jgi:hypothetical protein